MRVGIDATAWSNPRGDGRFVRNAVASLVAIYPQIEWRLYVDASSAAELEPPEGAAVRRVPQRRPSTEALGAGSRRGVVDLVRLTLAVRRSEVDAFLSPVRPQLLPGDRGPLRGGTSRRDCDNASTVGASLTSRP